MFENRVEWCRYRCARRGAAIAAALGRDHFEAGRLASLASSAYGEGALCEPLQALLSCSSVHGKGACASLCKHCLAAHLLGGRSTRRASASIAWLLICSGEGAL
eukprot:1161282-Pelagomonas_calceolata.AAC.12